MKVHCHLFLHYGIMFWTFLLLLLGHVKMPLASSSKLPSVGSFFYGEDHPLLRNSQKRLDTDNFITTRLLTQNSTFSCASGAQPISFTDYVELNLTGKPSLVTSQDMRTLEHSFVRTYNQLFNCNMHGASRILDNVTILNSTATATGTNPSSVKVQKFTYLVVARGRTCNYCTQIPTIILFRNDSSKAPTYVSNNGANCDCAGLNMSTFIGGFNATLASNNLTVNDTITSAVSVSQLETQTQCTSTVKSGTFTTTYNLPFANETFSTAEINSLETAIQHSYNSLNGGTGKNCDPHQRKITGVKFLQKVLMSSNSQGSQVKPNSGNSNLGRNLGNGPGNGNSKQGNLATPASASTNQAPPNNSSAPYQATPNNPNPAQPVASPGNKPTQPAAPPSDLKVANRNPINLQFLVTGSCADCGSVITLTDYVSRRLSQQQTIPPLFRFGDSSCLCPAGSTIHEPTKAEVSNAVNQTLKTMGYNSSSSAQGTAYYVSSSNYSFFYNYYYYDDDYYNDGDCDNYGTYSPNTTQSPSSLHPTITPSPSRSLEPSHKPSRNTSSAPSVSDEPSSKPSQKPSFRPSVSVKPSSKPSQKPTIMPSVSVKPSSKPSQKPTIMPSVSAKPSSIPSQRPSSLPSESVEPSFLLQLIVEP